MGELQKSLSSLKRAGSKNYGVLENEAPTKEAHTNPTFFTSKVMPENARYFEQSSFDSTENATFQHPTLTNPNFQNSPIKPITSNASTSNSSFKNSFVNQSSTQTSTHQNSYQTKTTTNTLSLTISPSNLSPSSISPPNDHYFQHKRSSSVSSTADSGFTSPKNQFSRAGSTSSSHSRRKTNNQYKTDLLKSNFQYETKSAVTFETYQNPVSLVVNFPNLFISCKGRQGCINYFQLDFKNSKDSSSQSKNTLVSREETLKISKNPLRIKNSFKIMVDSMPQLPSGMMINESGETLYVAINHFIAEIKISDLHRDNLTEIQPKRLIGKELEILHSIIAAPFDHFIVTDITRGAVSLVDREHGDVVFDYSTVNDLSALRNPRHVRATPEGVVVTDECRTIHFDKRQSNSPNCIFGGEKECNERPSAIACDGHGTILLATKQMNYSKKPTTKLQLLTVNGAIICDDVVKHRSLTTAGNWDEFPVVLDIRLMENYVLLLGDDKMVHIYSLHERSENSSSLIL